MPKTDIEAGAQQQHGPPLSPPSPPSLAFIGRLGGFQQFVVNRHDAGNGALLAKDPDAAPGMTLAEQFDLRPFATPDLWKAAVMSELHSSSSLKAQENNMIC